MKMRIGSLRLTTEPDNAQQLNEMAAKLDAISRSQAVIEFDLQGNIITANESFLHTMGYQLAEIQGKHHRIFVDDITSSSAEYRQFWETLARGQFKSDEFRRKHKDGSDVWIQATYTPILDQSGVPYKVVKFATNITEQKNLNAHNDGEIKAISKSQAVIHFDLDGRILWANDNFLHTMGYELNEVKGQHHSIFVTAEAKSSTKYQEFWWALKRGEFRSGEFHRIAKSGESVWIHASYNPIMDAAGNPVKVVKYASDITSQKLKNADFEGQVNAISKSQAVIEFNMDGTIITANDNFLNAMGYSLAEVQGQHHNIFVEPKFAQSPEYQQFWASLKQGKYQTAEYKRLGKGGKEVWIQASYNPILDMNGHPFKVVKFASDITQQKLYNAYVKGQIEAIGKSQAVIEFLPDGSIETANDNFLDAMGYRLGEVQGKHHSMFVASADRNSPEYLNFWQKLKAGQYQSGEFKRVSKNGDEVWIQASYNPILDSEGHTFKVVKYATDITAQKLQNADFEGQIEAIGKSQAVIQFNLDSTIIDANQNFLNAMGYSLDEVAGRKHSMFAPPGVAESAEYAQFWDNLRAGKFQSGEFKRIGKNGEDVWIQASYNPIFNMNGKVFKVVKYATDITQDKMLSNDNQGKLVAINKAQASIEFELDGTIITANQNFLDAMGYRLEEIQGKHHSLFVDSEIKHSHEYRHFWQELREGNFQMGEYPRISKSGSVVWISASYNPIFDLNGNPYRVVKYATDVTGRVKAVNAVRRAMAALSDGDLSRSIDESFIPEFEDIKNAINDTVHRLRDIVAQINDAAMEVNSGANEIAQGNQDLSDRTEQQASSLQQTAASMEEMTSTVQENARNSEQANNLVMQARTKAEQGGNIVNTAVASMLEINQSSRKIADIIGVIDEIAFQTNLLALNAAVEAARAGEDGRGFAVVATEVRNLAQRSAGAAKQIKELIEDSLTKVEEGSHLVNQSGDTLKDIVQSVNLVTEMVQKITESSMEQSSGIGEINSAMAQMDGMTQQNAALVEEATAASRSLTDLSRDMIERLNFFRVK